jgi:hypothetical protein
MSKVPLEKVQELRDFIDREIPDFKVVYKDEPGWHKTNFSTFVAWLFVGFVGFFVASFKKKFNERYSNGLQGNTLVLPSRSTYGDWTDANVYKIVRHEVMHLLDQRKHPIWFPLSFICVLPVIFTMRAYWELRGYTATMVAHYELNGNIPEWMISFIAKKFTGGMYFWMFPFPSKIRSILEKTRDKIYKGDIEGFYW